MIDISDLLITALVAAGMSYFLTSRLVVQQVKWQLQEKKINYIENRCQELMEMSINYWSAPKTQDNREKFTVYEIKISMYVVEISHYLNNNFTDLSRCEYATLIKNLSKITSDDFGNSNRRENVELARNSGAYVLEILKIISNKKDNIVDNDRKF